ncbi:putative quinol monooxygenase [Mailhella massiliensis]|uniref:Antibiotic biosynthesis monooxygenase n=1 Tax=Mailhella massiliensis TaxID=1903261 RepID=A0A921AXL6_9BACT|nr:antibiotic biosynthesis monooxygenase [Mailhella massiliensis]HJD97916.1 antibiotic biosynthesis monooxygenase [Mailhella massiliensis]
MKRTTNEEIDVIAILTVRKGMEEEFKEEVKKFMITIVNHDGLLYHSFHQSQEQPQDFIFYERYLSAMHLDLHTRSQEIKKWTAVRDRYVIKRTFITARPLLRLCMKNSDMPHEDREIIIPTNTVFPPCVPSCS